MDVNEVFGPVLTPEGESGKHPMSGKLYREYYVVCGNCDYEIAVGSRDRAHAVYYLARAGWRQTKLGYVCKKCLKGENR